MQHVPQYPTMFVPKAKCLYLTQRGVTKASGHTLFSTMLLILLLIALSFSLTLFWKHNEV